MSKGLEDGCGGYRLPSVLFERYKPPEPNHGISHPVTSRFCRSFLSVLGLIIAATMAILVVAISWMYFSDISQTRQAIRRNYPVIGRFRYFFEHLGEFLDNTFLRWIAKNYPSIGHSEPGSTGPSKNEDSTIAFGSTQPQNIPGEFVFLNGLFPPLESEVIKNRLIHFGTQYARHPYSTNSFFNISGMSYGALSGPE